MFYIDREKGLHTPGQQGAAGDGGQHHSLLFDAGVGVSLESSVAAVSTACREGARAFGELHGVALPHRGLTCGERGTGGCDPETGRGEEPGSARVETAVVLCVRADDEGCDAGAGAAWADVAGHVWGDWAVCGGV